MKDENPLRTWSNNNQQAREMGIHAIDGAFYACPAFSSNFTLVGKQIVSK